MVLWIIAVGIALLYLLIVLVFFAGAKMMNEELDSMKVWWYATRITPGAINHGYKS